MNRLISLALGGLLCQTFAGAEPVPSENRYLNSPSASQFPQSNAVFLSDEVRFKVAPDGSTEYDEHDVIKLFTPAGIEEHQELVRLYRSDLETMVVDRARTISPDGRVVEVPPSAIADQPVFEPGKSQVHQNLRRLSIRYPELTPNSIIEFKLRTQKRAYPGRKWWAVSYVQNPEPMLESRFVVEVPQGTPWRFSNVGYSGITPEKVQLEGVEQTTWTIRQSPPLEQEAMGPNLLLQMKRLEVSNFDNWSQLRQWFDQGFEAACETEGATTIQLRKLVKGTPTPPEILDAIGAWANKKRFISGTLDDFRPSLAGLLVEEQTLNVLDSAILLASLYRQAGLSVTPALAFEAPPEVLQGELPRLNRVDNLLLRVKSPSSEQTWWIDPRHPLEYSEVPPSGLQGGAFLVAREEQPWEKLSSTPADSNALVTRVEARLDERGKLELSFNTVGHGSSASAYREAGRELLATAQEQREQQLDRLFGSIASGYGSRARVLGHYFNLNPRAGQPIDFAATLAVPDYVFRLGGKLAVVMPVRMNPQLLNLAESPVPRQQPVRLHHPWREDCQLRLHLPPGVQVSELPQTVELKSPYGSYYSTCSSKDGEVYYFSRLVLNEAWVPSDRASEFAQFAKQVVKARGRLLLDPPLPQK